MDFGPLPPRQLPQQDPAKVLLLAERWQRATYAFSKWAEPAKQCVDFFRGRQWTAAQLAEMAAAGRAALKFNIISPIVRLVLGYQANNKTDITFMPGDDSIAMEHIADALTAIEKKISKANWQEFVDGEVFLDGLVCGRGWFDTRLDFKNNDLGDVRTKALDPFTVKPDPDAYSYDLNETAAYMQIDKMVSLDEIEGSLGKPVADLVRPWTMGQTPQSTVTSIVVNDEITPVRTFGLREDSTDYWDSFYSLMGDFVDPHRKTIRAIETQYKMRELRNVFIDLEVGDTKVIPQDWTKDKIEKCLLYAEMAGNPMEVQRRMVERIHWTTMVADIIIHDRPSPYDAYTMTGYFPLFIRGDTAGMVEDLVDPQKEKNKRRSARIETEAHTANGGWLTHESSLDPVQKAKLKKWGSTPGFNLEWQGAIPPVQIQPNQPNVGAQRLEADADQDVQRISGVNAEALGNEETAKSGRAIEARQRQAVISVQLYMSNFKRSKQLLGERHLSLMQDFYTEQRYYRVTGEDGKASQLIINQSMRDPISGAKRMLNDITLGKYSVMIDEAPISATFASAQWEETLTLLEKLAPVLGPQVGAFADLILQSSSIPRKEEWIARWQQIMGNMGAAGPTGAPAAPPPPGGGHPGVEPSGTGPAPQPGMPGPPLRALPGGPNGGNVVPMPGRA